MNGWRYLISCRGVGKIKVWVGLFESWYWVGEKEFRLENRLGGKWEEGVFGLYFCVRGIILWY